MIITYFHTSVCNGSSVIVMKQSKIQISHSPMFPPISLRHSALSGGPHDHHIGIPDEKEFKG
jgi:hypothetical protein